jgi:hypothetical protein
MEPHHHFSHDLGLKSWKSYLWEFLMLFLAVFAASLAEYQLEHKIERDKEKQYIKSMVSDLATDTTKLSTTIRNNKEIVQRIDTTLAMYKKLTLGFNDTLLVNLLQSVVYASFINTDRTMQQLKNAGAMRLIKSPSAANAILDYDSKMRTLVTVTIPNTHDILIQHIAPLFNQVVDTYGAVYDLNNKPIEQLRRENNTYLISKNPAKLTELRNYLYAHQCMCSSTINDEMALKNQAIKLIKLLKKEYRLE